MSGSIKTFVYTTNGGDEFAINMDESNGEAVGNADYTTATDVEFFLPRNITPRSASYRSLDGRYQRRITVTDNEATVSSLPASIDIQTEQDGEQEVFLSIFNGETVKVIPRAADSGIDDGDSEEGNGPLPGE